MIEWMLAARRVELTRLPYRPRLWRQVKGGGRREVVARQQQKGTSHANTRTGEGETPARGRMNLGDQLDGSDDHGE